MKRDDILNMPAGREMDALVAIIDSHTWRDYNWWDGSTKKLLWADWYGYEPKGDDFQHLDDNIICDWGLPSYSADISAAWRVVEKMRDKSIATTISTMGYKDDTNVITVYEGRKICKVYAPTAPLAICRAALLAILEVEE